MGNMFVEERQEEILNLLYRDGKVRVKDLSEKFGVTEDCIRKDLASLEKRDLLQRAYGGAVIKERGHKGHSQKVSARHNKNTEEKKTIAKKAVQLIKDGDVIFLDTSTTNEEIAKEILKSGKKVRVVSSMLDIANVFAGEHEVEFILLGGTYYQSQNSYLGAMTLQMLAPFRFDLAFIGVVGADLPQNALSTYEPDDGILKKMAMEQSRNVYLAMESQKFEFQGNYAFGKWEDVTGVICETSLDKEKIQQLKKYGVKDF